MKFLIFVIPLITGCATFFPKNTKEQMRDIFVEIKNSRLDEGQRLANGIQSGAEIETYLNDRNASPSEWDTKGMIATASSYIRECNHILKQSDPQLKLENNRSEPALSVDELKDSFLKNCDLEENEMGRKSTLVKINELWNVNFIELDPKYKREFKKNIKPIEDRRHKAELNRQNEMNAKVAKKEAYENSAEYYSIKLCEMRDRVKLGQSVIKEENDAGKISGMVDKDRLYEAGKVIQINQKGIKHFGDEYRSKFGNDWDESQCK